MRPLEDDEIDRVTGGFGGPFRLSVAGLLRTAPGLYGRGARIPSPDPATAVSGTGLAYGVPGPPALEPIGASARAAIRARPLLTRLGPMFRFSGF